MEKGKKWILPCVPEGIDSADTLIQSRETCFGLLTNRTVRESICVVSSHEGGGDLSQQPQEMSTSMLLDGLGSLSEPWSGHCKWGSPREASCRMPTLWGEFRHKYTPKPEHRRVLEMGYLKPIP